MTFLPIGGGRRAVSAVAGLWRLATLTRLRRRVLVVTACTVGAGLVGVAAAVLLLVWRLSEGPIRLEAIDNAIESAVARELGDVRVEIMGAELARDADGSTVVRLADVTIRDRTGQFLARAPQAVVTTRLISAALGRVDPTGIELIGPHVTVHRGQGGDISLGFRAAPPPEGIGGDDSDPVLTAQAGAPVLEVEGAQTSPSFSPLAMFSVSPDEPGFLGNIDRLLVRGARLTLFDEASQSVWDSYNASLRITRESGGVAVYVDAPFTTDTGEWRFRATIERRGETAPLTIDADFDSIVPSEIAARIPSLADLASFDLPVSGQFRATVSPTGNVEAVDGDIRLGAGFLRRIPFLDIEMSPFLLDEGRVSASYDRAENKLDLQHLSVQIGSNRIALSGSLSPELTETGAIVAARFDLRAQNLTLAATDIGAEPAIIRRALASGRFMLDRSRVEVDTVIAEFEQGRVTLGATAGLGGQRQLAVQGALEQLPVAALMQIWPRQLAPGARAWVGRHIRAGTLSDGRIRVMLDAADLAAADAGQAMSDDAIDIDFALDGVTADYFSPLPALENATGTGQLSGDRFVLSVESAVARAPGGAPIAVTYGRFEVPTFADDERGQIVGRLNVGISGATSAALEVLDLQPLEFTREIGVDVSKVRGDATIVFDLDIPLVEGISFSDITFQAGASVSNLAVADAFQSISLEAEELEIIATPRRVDARGDVFLNGVPARAVWEVRFDEPGQRANRLVIETDTGADGLARLGIDLSRYLAGTAPVTLEATGPGSQLDRIEVSADVIDAEIRLPAIGWSKPSGEPARLGFVVERLDNGQVRLREINLDGDQVKVEGAIRFDPDGSIYKVDISRLRLGPANDLAITGVRRADGILHVEVSGAGFDAGELLRREIADEAPRQANAEARPAEIDFAVTTVRGAKGVPLGDATGRIQVSAGKVAGIRLNGRFASGERLEVNYALGAGAESAVVDIQTGDAGEFIRFLGLYERAHGGAMTVRAKGPDARSLAGQIVARDFNIRDEQLLVRIAETTSGFAARRARDVKFDRLNLEFARQGGAIEVRDALIGGPAVGASIRGRIDIAGEILGLSGTYIPAYGLNAAFGAIPLFGPILSGRSGEGVFGMTFEVEGPMSAPSITVNPMSAIAPGLLRRFFEFRQR